MDNFSLSQQNLFQTTPYNYTGFQRNFSTPSSYSAQRNLESQPMYIAGKLMREGFDTFIANTSNMIGSLSENFTYAKNNLMALYYGENKTFPDFSIPGLTGEINTTRLEDSDFSVFIQSLRAEYEAQNSLRDKRLCVRVASFKADYTEIYLKDFEHELLFTTALSTPSVNLTDIINHYTPELLSEISDLKLKHIKNKDIFDFATTLKSEDSKGVGKVTIKERLFSYNAQNPDLSFPEASDFTARHIHADKNLSPELLTYFGNKLFEQYPFIQEGKPCKSLLLHAPHSISDIILSHTYSAHPDITETQLHQALNTYVRFPYTTDVVNALAVSLAAGDAYNSVSSDYRYKLNGVIYQVHREEPLKIVHCQNNEEMVQHSQDKEASAENRGGYYSPEFNVVAFKGEMSDTSTNNMFTPAFIHESGHAVMNLLFKNDCQPFAKDNEHQNTLYKKAELNVFKHLAECVNISKSEISGFNTTEEVIQVIKASDELNKLVSEMAPSDELLVLTELHNIIYHYSPELRATELIVRVPQLLSQGVALNTVAKYFGPLMTYWDNTISPEVVKLHETVLASSQADQCLDFNKQNLTLFR